MEMLAVEQFDQGKVMRNYRTALNLVLTCLCSYLKASL